MNLKTKLLIFLAVLFLSTGFSLAKSKGGTEYSGQFDTTLVPNVEDFEKVIFKATSADRWKSITTFSETAHFAEGRLLNPQTQQYSIVSLFVEEVDKVPVIFIDVNGDKTLTADEKFAFEQSKADNPYLWKTTANLSVKNDFFTSCPLFLQYFKSIQTEKMTRDDRLITQSTEVLARGKADVKGKKVLVQYAYSFDDKKVNPKAGWLGVDVNEDGEIDMDNLSPEAAKANDESVIFRVGETYLSTKKADVAKNQILMREHDAKDYKRIELYISKEFPEFSFTDFDGKKRKLSEFRGKYILLDIWGFWCPPCRKELPYIREAYKRFQNRNLEILGLNTDEDFTPDSMKKALNDSGMKWQQARFDSVVEFLKNGLRVNSFPTTFLIAPDGKILSMSRHERGEPDLRGADLLESLDEILPD